MSHVDEGQLHAYVDGAFTPGDAQAVEIEAHLGLCADCRVRLEETRALKDRARQVLHHAAPVDVRVPPFDDVHARRPGVAADPAGLAGAEPTGAIPNPRDHRARRDRRRRHTRAPHTRWAWAATVVIAAGAGWMANELARQSPNDSATAPANLDSAMERAAPVESRDDPASATDASAAAPPATQRTPRANAASPQVHDGGAPVSSTAERDAAKADAERRPEAAPRAAAVDPANLPPPAVTTRPRANDATARERASERTAEDAARQAPPADASSVRPRIAAMAESARRATGDTSPTISAGDAGMRIAEHARDVIRLDTLPADMADGQAFAEHVDLLNDYVVAVGASAWRPVTPLETESWLGRDAAIIEDMEPAATEIAVVNGRALVRARYPLHGGATIELIQRPAAAPRRDVADRFADAPASRPSVRALPVGGIPLTALGERSPLFHNESVRSLKSTGLVVLLKGPVPQDSLETFAARIRF